jgi:putative ubiquitin-RnfH superfamily antitoxin RatB of RatAB toxin-antitoxin module
MITIEVAYARPDRQVILSLQVPEDTTIETAIKLSGISKYFPEIDLQTIKVGIFSKPVSSSEKLNAGDRVEIYRPLIIDPKQARLLRAKRKNLKKTAVSSESNAMVDQLDWP